MAHDHGHGGLRPETRKKLDELANDAATDLGNRLRGEAPPKAAVKEAAGSGGHHDEHANGHDDHDEQAHAEEEHHGVRSGGEHGRARQRESLAGTMARAIEGNVTGLSPEVAERLRLDLLTNSTADYSRINLTEIFIAFNFDANQTATHWRLAKIMDGIAMCSGEFHILEDNLSPGKIPEKIYDVIRAGDVSEPTWAISVANPKNPEGEKEKFKASLTDFAYLVDTLKANRELGLYRIPINELLYKFFKGEDIVTRPIVEKNEAGKVFGKKTLNLRGQAINPRDSYAGQDAIDIEAYIKYVKKSQTGMQQVGDWRYDSDKHRELAAQTYLARLEGGIYWIPNSGRLAAEVSNEDLQKSSADGGKAAINGQPQEVGEMEESQTGNIVRFRMRDLVQRNVGGTVQSLSGTTRRMHKAMMGLNLKEEAAKVFSEKVDVPNPDGSSEKKETKVVYLCGNDERGRSGDIIKAMHVHYDKAMKKSRGFGLSNDEAYDLALVDVFAPCILNNANDWLIALAKVYPDIGGGSGERGIVQNPNKFNFLLRIKCYDPEEDRIRWQDFHGFNDLLKYIRDRVKLGHIDQPIEESSGQLKQEDAPLYEAVEKFENADQASNYAALATELLGEYAGEYLADYASGNRTMFKSVRTANGELIPFDPGQKNKVEGRTKLTFDQIILKEIQTLKDEGRIGEIFDLLSKIYSPADDFDVGKMDELQPALDAFVNTLAGLPPAERQKLKA